MPAKSVEKRPSSRLLDAAGPVVIGSDSLLTAGFIGQPVLRE